MTIMAEHVGATGQDWWRFKTFTPPLKTERVTLSYWLRLAPEWEPADGEHSLGQVVRRPWKGGVLAFAVYRGGSVELRSNYGLGSMNRVREEAVANPPLNLGVVIQCHEALSAISLPGVDVGTMRVLHGGTAFLDPLDALIGVPPDSKEGAPWGAGAEIWSPRIEATTPGEETLGLGQAPPPWDEPPEPELPGVLECWGGLDTAVYLAGCILTGDPNMDADDVIAKAVMVTRMIERRQP